MFPIFPILLHIYMFNTNKLNSLGLDNLWNITAELLSYFHDGLINHIHFHFSEVVQNAEHAYYNDTMQVSCNAYQIWGNEQYGIECRKRPMRATLTPFYISISAWPMPTWLLRKRNLGIVRRMLESWWKKSTDICWN